MHHIVVKAKDGINVQAGQRHNGHWIADPQNLQTTTEYCYICSECGRRIHLLVFATLNDYPYCHCGAKMIESQESEE